MTWDWSFARMQETTVFPRKLQIHYLIKISGPDFFFSFAFSYSALVKLFEFAVLCIFIMKNLVWKILPCILPLCLSKGWSLEEDNQCMEERIVLRFFNLDICVMGNGPKKNCPSMVWRTWVCGWKAELCKGNDNKSLCTAAWKSATKVLVMP